MTEQEEVKEQEKKAEKEKAEIALALAAAEKTETPKEQYTIPKSRLDEEIKRRKDSDKKLVAIEKEKASELEKHLEEQGRWEEIAKERAKTIAELQPKADQLDSALKTLTDNLVSRIADLPEASQDLVPSEMTTQQQLDWISKHNSRLMKPNAPDLHIGRRGGEGGETIELSAEERQTASDFGMNAEDYAKYKDKE